MKNIGLLIIILIVSFPVFSLLADPILTCSPNSLELWEYGNTPISNYYVLSATGLPDAPGHITIKSNYPYVVSMDYYGRFSDSISIAYSSSTLSDTIVYVRLWWGQALGPVARDSIKNYVGNTATNVYCTGYVDYAMYKLICSPSSLSSFDYAANEGPSHSQSFIVQTDFWEELNLQVSCYSYYELSNDNITFTKQIYTRTGSKIYVRLIAGLQAGGYYSNEIYMATNQAGVSDYYFDIYGSVSNAMPVELSIFTAIANERNICLNWATQTEKNSDKFEIERLANLTWINIGSVKASILSNSPKKYSYTDKNLQSGKYQYRLKMIDNDGTFKYSKVIETEIAIPKEFELSQNYPNPFNPNTVISYSLPLASEVKLIVYNSLGQTVKVLENGFMNAGNYSVNFNANELSSGTYFYKIEAGHFSQVKKMLLLK